MNLFMYVCAVLLRKLVNIGVCYAKRAHEISPLPQVDVFSNELELTIQRFKDISTHQLIKQTAS